MPFARRKERTHRHTAGSLDSMGLPEIVQTVALGSKTARLTVRSPCGEGEIRFVDGIAVHAATEGAVGDDAFLEIVGWESGTFLLEHDVGGGERTVESDAMFLVLEGVRRRDEGSTASPPPVFHAAPPRRPRAGRAIVVVLVVALAGAGASFLLRDPPRRAAVPGARSTAPSLPPAVAEGGTVAERERQATEPTATAPTARSRTRSPRAPEPEPERVAVSVPEPEPLPLLDLPPASVRLVTTSRLKRGLLTVSWDGATVHEGEIESSYRGARRFFRTIVGKGAETSAVDIEIPAGIGELALCLSIDGEPAATATVPIASPPDTLTVIDVDLGRRRIEALARAPVADAGEEIAGVVGGPGR